MWKQVYELPYLEVREAFLDLQNTLLPLFARSTPYTSTEQLRDDFTYLAEFEDEVIADEIQKWLKRYPDVQELLLLKVNYQRFTVKPLNWKLCVICKKPYLDFTVFQKSITCSSQIYRGYKTGKGYTASHENRSVCNMEHKRLDKAERRRGSKYVREV